MDNILTKIMSSIMKHENRRSPIVRMVSLGLDMKGRPVQMPVIGLGTRLLTHSQTIADVLHAALWVGYRHFDTSPTYGNQEEVGSLLHELLPLHNIKREQVFISAKLSASEHCAVPQAIERTLQTLHTSYVDCYIVEWPGTDGLLPNDPLNTSNRAETWEQMQTVWDTGKARSIGVANYTHSHMTQLLRSSERAPCLLQTEFHPFNADYSLYGLCSENGVHMQAYGALGGGYHGSNSKGELMRSNNLYSLCQRYKHTSEAQLLFSWCLTQNLSVLVGTNRVERLRHNLESVTMRLPEEAIISLSRADAIGSPEEHLLKYCWDAHNVV